MKLQLQQHSLQSRHLSEHHKHGQNRKHAQVEEIRQVIALLGLDSGQSFALQLRSIGELAVVPPEHRGTMERIWGRTEHLALTTMQLCTQVLRMQGPDIESLMSATYDRCAPGSRRGAWF